MHIVFLTTEYPGVTSQSGGIAEYTRKISQGLADLGHVVSIIIAGEKDFTRKVNNVNLISFKAQDYWKGIDGNALNQTLRVFRVLLNSYKFSRVVMKFNRREKIDILQAPNYLSPLLFIRNNKFPIICRISSYAKLYREAYGKKNNFINNIEDTLELLSVNRSFSVFSPSKLLKEIYFTKLKIEITVIKTPVDRSFLNRHEVLEESTKKKLRNFKTITYFGSLSRLKGTDLIVDIIPNLINKYKDILFLFVGKDYGIPGYGPVATYINEKIGKKSSRIIIKDQLEKKELFSLIQGSYCCIFPSRIDNSPNACIEAISLGIPVIGSDNSSLEEMIINNETGYIFINSDSNDLEDKVEKILNLSSNKYKEMKKNVNILYKVIRNEKRTQALITYYEKTLDDFNSKK
ncbi:glycosyltransferase family 4 protein [Candidatus Dojkabacteria bacterium]|nr:glycosyltransferase family 4 protein [Candidatus Dojkabacteria bacterium]